MLIQVQCSTQWMNEALESRYQKHIIPLDQTSSYPGAPDLAQASSALVSGFGCLASPISPLLRNTRRLLLYFENPLLNPMRLMQIPNFPGGEKQGDYCGESGG
jgi:hypothetical protein